MPTIHGVKVALIIEITRGHTAIKTFDVFVTYFVGA